MLAIAAIMHNNITCIQMNTHNKNPIIYATQWKQLSHNKNTKSITDLHDKLTLFYYIYSQNTITIMNWNYTWNTEPLKSLYSTVVY